MLSLSIVSLRSVDSEPCCLRYVLAQRSTSYLSRTSLVLYSNEVQCKRGFLQACRHRFSAPSMSDLLLIEAEAEAQASFNASMSCVKKDSAQAQ